MPKRNPSGLLASNRPTGSLRVEPGLFSLLPRLIRAMAHGEKVFIITDSIVLRLYGAALQRKLVLGGTDVVLLEMPPGEKSKSQGVLSSLHSQLLLHGAGRRSLILALGGGVVGDVGGFAAATVVRGIRYVQVPTSLLAQVDSSIGGKVGINHRLGKNLIGAFYPPVKVFIDPVLLKTLPVDEFRNGLAEVVKIAFACDAGFFHWLERHQKTINRMNQELLVKLVRKSSRLKSSIVRKDVGDEGIRQILNFGHTIGHAIEAASGYTVSHGKAVSIGMAVESGIAVEMGLLKERDRVRLLKLLRAFRLPSAFPTHLNKSVFLKSLKLDKKGSPGIQRFSLPKGIGKMIPGVEVSSADTMAGY